MEARSHTTPTHPLSEKNEIALQSLGVGVGHPLRALMRLHKGLAFELLQGDRIKVSLGEHLVADDLVPYVPPGVSVSAANGEVLLLRNAPAGCAEGAADQAGGLANVDSDLRMPSRPILWEAGSAEGSIPAKNSAARSSSVASLSIPPTVGRCDEEIREACEALHWVAGEREVLRGAVAAGATLHLEVFERAVGGSLELRHIGGVDHRDVLNRLGFRPTSNSAWCCEWRKIPSERGAAEQIATVSLGCNPLVSIFFE